MLCDEYKTQMGIGTHATRNQARDANVAYFAQVIDQACAIEIINSVDQTTVPGNAKDNTLMVGGFIAAGIIFGAILYKKRRK